jgi:glycosyltransferase involved in cell wall biosynthesis
MRVLVLCKRQYTHKDVIDDCYGRLFELPAALVERGHDVAAAVTSYRQRGRQLSPRAGVLWHSVDAWPHCLDALRAQTAFALRSAPQVIWASADVFQLVAGIRLGRRLGVPVVLDWYDDYAAFGLSRLPGMQHLLRWACARADGLSMVSETLRKLLPTRGKVPSRMAVIGNGIPQDFPSALDRVAARTRLGLPLDTPLIGTAGALESGRGIEDLLAAFSLLRARCPGLRLVLAGPRKPSTTAMLPEGVIDLGMLPYTQVPLLLRSLDVGVICNRDSAFGRACYPQKLGEMVSCGLPVVAAAVGESALLLRETPGCLYPPGEPVVLAERLDAQLKTPQYAPATLAMPWQQRGEALEALLREVVEDHPLRART